MKVLILGVGNLLLTDEGVGIHAVQTLLRDYVIPESITVIDGGTAGMELLFWLAQTDHLILLDAVNTGQSPGTIIRFDNQQIPVLFRTKLSPHQIGLADVLAALTLIGDYPQQVTLFGVEPASLALGMNLSEPVASQMPCLLELVIAEVEKLGISIRPSKLSNTSKG